MSVVTVETVLIRVLNPVSKTVVLPGSDEPTRVAVSTVTRFITSSEDVVTVVKTPAQQGVPGIPGPTGPQGPIGGAEKFREDRPLVGAIDNANVTYVLPASEKAVNITAGGLRLKIALNGRLLSEDAGDFTASESLVGFGFDTLVLVQAPAPGDTLRAHYVLV